MGGYFLMPHMLCWSGEPQSKVCRGGNATTGLTSRGTRVVSESMSGCDGGKPEVCHSAKVMYY